MIRELKKRRNNESGFGKLGFEIFKALINKDTM